MASKLKEQVERIGSLGDAVAAIKIERAKPPEPSDSPEAVSMPRVDPTPPYVRGRPASYTEALAIEICRRIEGGETLTEICEAEYMPTRQVALAWCDHFPTFAASFVRARALQAEAIAERGVARATKATPMTASADRLYFDGMRWLAGKLDPARWSDKADINVTVRDPDGDARRAELRGELLAGLQRLAKSEPLTIESDDTKD